MFQVHKACKLYKFEVLTILIDNAEKPIENRWQTTGLKN